MNTLEKAQHQIENDSEISELVLGARQANHFLISNKSSLDSISIIKLQTQRDVLISKARNRRSLILVSYFR